MQRQNIGQVPFRRRILFVLQVETAGAFGDRDTTVGAKERPVPPFMRAVHAHKFLVCRG